MPTKFISEKSDKFDVDDVDDDGDDNAVLPLTWIYVCLKNEHTYVRADEDTMIVNWKIAQSKEIISRPQMMRFLRSEIVYINSKCT